MSQQRAEKVKASVKTNSSMPDLVFYHLKTENEKVLGFMDNDSDEQFGKLARKGGEILLPGVLPRPKEITDHVGKPAEAQTKKIRLKDGTDVSNSDTETETLLFFGPSPPSEVNFPKLEAPEDALEESSAKKSRPSLTRESGTGSEDCDCCDSAPDVAASEGVLQVSFRIKQNNWEHGM